MQVWSTTAEVPRDCPPTSVTVGSFDGVHIGHRVLLDRVIADRADGLMPVAVTFEPHPLAVLRSQDAPLLLSTTSHKLDLLAAAGLDGVLVLPFTPSVAQLAPERFATVVLANTLHAKHVVVGRNFRFGHRAAGNVTLLAELGRELGFAVTVVDLAVLGDGPTASSTEIRARVAAGDIAAANAGLGRAHRVTGPVVHGDHRGRTLGFPTANIAVADEYAVPADGVYAGWLHTTSEQLPVAVSVGTNPTFADSQMQPLARRVEAYVIDAQPDLDLYDQVVDLDFVARLRGMQRFGSVSELIAAMTADVMSARELLEVGGDRNVPAL